jgi:hypothetical protein
VACWYIAGAADTCGGACATTERGVKLANIAPFACGLAPALLEREGGAEYVVDGGGRAGSEWCGCILGLFAMMMRLGVRRGSRCSMWNVP